MVYFTNILIMIQFVAVIQALMNLFDKNKFRL